MPRQRPPALPPLVKEKLTKSNYTRGAADSEPYQNRVKRNNTVLIDREFWQICRLPDDGSTYYENSFIVLLEPSWYFNTPDADDQLAIEGIELGKNALLVYRRRADWVSYGPEPASLPNGLPFNVATARKAPLGGVYFARIHATTSSKGVVEGFNSSSIKGAGIRVWEYASTATLQKTVLQLEALIWQCYDVEPSMAEAGMPTAGIATRRDTTLRESSSEGLLDYDRLRSLRVINAEKELVCPLCLRRISANEFLRKIEQAEGRGIFDLTTTEISLFHIQELRIGTLQHKPYNVGWGHQHCNTVVKDDGIAKTVEWMKVVIANQSLAEGELGEVTESVEKAVDG